MKVIYTAIFLDGESKNKLLASFPPLHPKVFGHHVTLVFKPSEEALKLFEPHLGATVTFSVVGEASDDKGQAVKVDLPAPYDRLWPQLHHVTISCVDSPVYSNTLLKQGWKSLDEQITLRGELRHFTA